MNDNPKSMRFRIIKEAREVEEEKVKEEKPIIDISKLITEATKKIVIE